MKLKEVLPILRGCRYIRIYMNTTGPEAGISVGLEVTEELPMGPDAGAWYVRTIRRLLTEKGIKHFLESEVTGISPFFHITEKMRELCERYPGLEPQLAPGMFIELGSG